jgi:hypothetical protein
MAKKRIFIGSAWETRDVAAQIARKLADSDQFEPLRWWEQFPLGSLTLDQLRAVAQGQVDGAVLLLTRVDKTWYREKSSEAPRDNVVLEFGLFVQALDRDRTIVLSDGARLPSDIAGITYERLTEDVSTAAERVLNHFIKVFNHGLLPLQDVTLLADPSVVEHQIRDPLPAGWHLRDCYLGTEGARAWLKVVDDPTYETTEQDRSLRSLLLRAVEGLDVRTFVSFGPGDANLDTQLAGQLRLREPLLQYIPVDISDGLLLRAVTFMQKKARVPVGILGDFEEGFSFIQQALQRYTIQPLLLALLGNTLGNLDRLESNFLSNVRLMLKKGDYLLLDISLASANWRLDMDSRGQPARYGDGHRRFIANGVAKRHGQTVEAVVRNFSKWIHFSDRTHSDIPNSKGVNIEFRESSRSRRLVYEIRRYDWNSIRAWLERFDLQVVFAEEAPIDDAIGDGVILLRAK